MAAISVASTLLIAGPGVAAEDDHVLLTVRGNAGVLVEGTCVVRSPAGESSERIAEAVPFERRWRGTGLRCELAADGPLTVEVSRGGNRNRTSTSGGSLVVEVR